MKGVIVAALLLLTGIYAPQSAETRIAQGSQPAESLQHIPFEAFAVYPEEVQIKYPGLKYAKVKSDSMAPWITHDSVIFEKPPVKEEIKPGEVISFYEPTLDAVVLHMVTGITEKEGKTFYRTKGIANEQEDNWLVPFENVKGIMVGMFR